MHPRLEYYYERIETQRKKLIISLRSVSPETLNRHPDGKWSINQIVAHLVSSERLSVNYITKKIQGIESLTDSGLVEELKMILLKISQRLPLKFKAPKLVVENTLQEKDLDKLIDEWNHVRDELNSLLKQIEDRHARKMVYRHPRVGMINLQHALQFFREHIIHHTPQIKRLMK